MNPVKYPLKGTRQVIDSWKVLRWATDTQSVGDHCEKKNLRNLTKGIDRKTSIWYICKYEDRNHEG